MSQVWVPITLGRENKCQSQNNFKENEKLTFELFKTQICENNLIRDSDPF